MISAECSPFAKSGGLGDVIGALPRYLKNYGHEVIVVMPLYSFIDRKKFNITTAIEKTEVWVGNDLITFSVGVSGLYGDVPIYFLAFDPFFDRPGMYHDSYYNDYQDNPKRFAFLSKAALQLCHEINFKPDIVHANDWHTAVSTAFLKRFYNEDPYFSNAASVLTIHNIAYQGRYNRYFYFYTGLNWEDFTKDKFEHYNDVNFLKGGIHFADMINTVSKGYAAETKTPPMGYGLEYFLNKREDDYTGILNGADYSQWDPSVDRLIPANCTKDDLEGKRLCKEVLQKNLGLEQSENIPVVGIVSRLVEQKGFHIIAACVEELVQNNQVQFAILGSGDNHLENFFNSLQQKYPEKTSVFIGYDNELAHLIEAGSDFFLMPSLYEPCGLNQIYSLKYGTLPIVRATGGLNDTVKNYNPSTAEGTGFMFWEPSCVAASNTIRWALDTYHNRKDHMKILIDRAMQQYFSWDESARQYIEMYRKAKMKKETSVSPFVAARHFP